MQKIFLSVILILLSAVAYSEGEFKPYKITPGISYYSNEYSIRNGVAQLGAEKNFEEIYQNYNYYEAVFDEQQRMVVFKAYKRGSIEFSETYVYEGVANVPARKIITSPDGAEIVVEL